MSIQRPPALRRRTFVLSIAGAAGALALPTGALAAPPARSALAFDGDALLVARGGLERITVVGEPGQALPVPGGISALTTHSGRPGRILVAVANGVVLSNDGGQSWQARDAGLPGASIQAISIAAAAPETFYAALTGDGLWQSEDAGRTWSFAMDRPWLAEAERDLLALASVDLQTGMGGIWVYAGTERGLTRVPDCFCRWQDAQPGHAMDALAAGDAPPPEAPLPADEAVLALASAPSSPSTLYAALPSGVWSSRDGGGVWAPLVRGAASAIAVHPADERHVAAIIDDTLHLSRDGGASWTALAAA